MVNPDGKQNQIVHLKDILPSITTEESFKAPDGDKRDPTDTGCHEIAMQKTISNYNYDETSNLIVALNPYGFSRKTNTFRKIDVLVDDFDQDNIELGGWFYIIFK